MVSTTVRGRQVKDGPLASPSTKNSRNPGKQEPLAGPAKVYEEAKEMRKKLDRSVKLEQFQERRIEERIKALEITRDAEIDHRKELEKMTARRLARKAELKKDLEEAWAHKLQLEQEEAQEEKKRQADKAEEQKRFQVYKKKQKERIQEWHRSLGDEEESTSTDLMERAKMRRQQLQEKAEQSILDSQVPPEHFPMKRKEVQAKVRDAQEAQEQRPPLAPKPHDNPKPVLQMVDEAAANASGASTAQKVPPKVGNWAVQAKAVSGLYGLSAETVNGIESQIQRTVKGGGRMASYDDARSIKTINKARSKRGVSASPRLG